MKNKLISILIISIVFVSCSKYEDGPILSFRSKKTRIEGSWKYSSIIYVDQNITVTDHLPDTVMTFTKENEYSDNHGYTGSWKFSGTVDLTITKTLNGNTEEKSWEILRLAKKQLWLRYNKVDYHFVPK
jgi:hypothetical protein